MPSTYTSSLRLEKQATGENLNLWGQRLNLAGGSDLVDFAIAGVTDVALAATNVVLTTADGTSDEARAAVLNCTGTLSANVAVIIPNVPKIYAVYNGTSGAFTLTVRTAGGSGPEIVQGTTVNVWCDGNDTTRVIGATDTSAVEGISDDAVTAHNNDLAAHYAASETQRGFVELATDTETQTGTDTARAITPANLSARTATIDRTGVVELATNAEAVTGTDTARAVTPAGLSAFFTANTGGAIGNAFGTTIGVNYVSFYIPGGLLVQMGNAPDESGSDNGTASVVFPTAFDDTPYVICGFTRNNVGGNLSTAVLEDSPAVSTTGFSYRIYEREPGGSYNGYVTWLAIGAGTQ